MKTSQGSDAMPTAPTEEDAILSEIAQGGARADRALRRLYDSLGQPMLRFFVFQGASADEAQDVLQDTLIKVYKSAGQYNGQGTAKAWIWQVARNTLLDAFRKSQRIRTDEVLVNPEQWSHFEESVASPQACHPAQSVDECVADGLERFALEMPDRALALNLYLEGASMEDISVQIGRSAAATKEYLSQCRKKIKPFIAQCTEQLAD
jgi:RNA polymerase sigma-70 factor (ECF subfamily)